LILSIPREIRARRIEPNSALKKPSTSRPGVIAPASMKSSAFITKENNPSVRKFIGSEINCTRGFINVLIIAIITHASAALQKPSTLIPGISQAIKIIAKA